MCPKLACEFENWDQSRILIMWVTRLPTQAWILLFNMIHIDTGIFSCCACQILVHLLGRNIWIRYCIWMLHSWWWNLLWNLKLFHRVGKYVPLHSTCVDSWWGQSWYFSLTAPGFNMVDATILCVLMNFISCIHTPMKCVPFWKIHCRVF